MNGNQINKKIRFPLIIMEIYFLCTIILYLFGPWEWKDNNKIITILLLIGYQLSLLIGFLFSSKKGFKYVRTIKFKINSLKIIIIVGLILTIFEFIKTLGTFSISQMFDRIISGIKNPNFQYDNHGIEIQNKMFGGKILNYISVLLAPISWLAIVLSIKRFKDLNFIFKIIAIINISLEALRWFGIGTNKGVIDVILILIFTNFIINYQRRKRYNYKFFVIFVLFSIIGLIIFNNNIGSRVEQNWIDFERSNGNTNINFDSPLMKICPKFLQPLLIYFSAYVNQGYYGFSLCRLVQWQPMYGIGNSMFLMENMNELFGIDFYAKTYQTKISIFGWDPLVNWHSIYTWLANDVSIYGVFIVLFILGMIFYKITYDAFVNNDDIASVLFVLIMIMFVYFPANNQVLSYPTTFMAFWVLLFFWWIKKYIIFKLRK